LVCELDWNSCSEGRKVDRVRNHLVFLCIVVLPIPACTPRVQVEPIEVKPIHIIHDVNIRVDRRLDEFFAFQEQAAVQKGTADQAPPQQAPPPSPGSAPVDVPANAPRTSDTVQ
jgi:hypothetical protein